MYFHCKFTPRMRLCIWDSAWDCVCAYVYAYVSVAATTLLDRFWPPARPPHEPDAGCATPCACAGDDDDMNLGGDVGAAGAQWGRGPS